MKRNVSIQESAYGRLPSAIAVEVGDIIQCDLGMRIVTEASKDLAVAICITGSDRPRTIEREISKSRIIERRGEDGLKNFLLHKRALQEEERRLAQANPETKDEDMKGKIRLEPGDQLMHGGEERTVVQVTDRRALLESAAGEQVWEKRVVSDFYFERNGTVLRFDEAERAKHLENFLASRKPKAAGSEPIGQITDNNTETTENDMAKKSKSKKAVKPKAAKAKAATNGKETQPEIMGFRVRAVMRKLGKSGADSEQVAAILKAKRITVPDGAISNEIKRGKSGKGALAELTKDQVAELMALAKE